MTAQPDILPSHVKQTPPCKLLTRLAGNQSADVTQVTNPPSSTTPVLEASCGGDVQCRKAYEVLMHYATSEEKLDYVAETLEKGCVADGKGGCAVKPAALWQALDNMCG